MKFLNKFSKGTFQLGIRVSTVHFYIIDIITSTDKYLRISLSMKEILQKKMLPMDDTSRRIKLKKKLLLDIKQKQVGV